MSTPVTTYEIAADELCSLGMRPWLMTGYLVEWFQLHFSRPQCLENPKLRSRLWNAAFQQSEIQVESATRYKTTDPLRRPAIVVRRDDVKNQRMGIDDRLQGDLDLHGNDHYATMVLGSHTLFCLSPTALEAEYLGMEVARELLHFGPLIRKTLDLKQFLWGGVGRIGVVEEQKQAFAVPVPVGYAYEENWEIVQHAPVLENIVLSKFLR